MKKYTVYFIFFFALATFLSSCGGVGKMKDQASAIKYKVEPKPLEMHQDSVALKITVEIPPEYMNKSVVLKVTPVLICSNNDREFSFKEHFVQGEEAEDSYDLISYEMGGTITYTDKIAYDPDMKVSELFLATDISYKGGEEEELDAVKIADGVITTSDLVNAGSMFDYALFVENEGSSASSSEAMKKAKISNKKLMAKTINASVKVQKTVTEELLADINYEKNKYKIRKSQSKKDDIIFLEERLKTLYEVENRKITSVHIQSSTSPEGGERLNESLAENRGEVAKSYLSEMFQEAMIVDNEEGFYNEIIDRKDWGDAEFKQVLSQSNVAEKDAILGVLGMSQSQEDVEQEIRNMVMIFENLDDEVLAKLRKSSFKILVETGGMSDDKIKELASSNPSSLTAKQLIYAAINEKDLAKKKQIYQACIKNYSNEWKAYNNLGNVFLLEDNISKAKELYEQARSKKSGEPIIANNMGVIALMENNLKKAEEEFKNAKGAGDAANYNLGVIHLKNGNYPAASRSFGSTPSFNAALSKILVGNSNTALVILDKLEGKDSGIYYYLKAIVSARTKDTDAMFRNLRTAIEKDASLGVYAKTDIEFGKFYEDDTFKTIVK